MTTVQMIQNFKMHYDIVNLEGPGYENEEVLVFLNQSQIVEVLKEVAIRRMTYITNLVKNDTLNSVDIGWSLYPYHRIVTPSEDYIGYISSQSLVTRTTFKPTSGAEWVGNTPIRKEVLYKYISNSNNWVILLSPRVYEDEGNVISIIHDRHTAFSGTNDFSLAYVRRPDDIAIGSDCEVNLIMHERIVNTAVNLAKKVFNPQEAGVSEQSDQLIKKPEL